MNNGKNRPTSREYMDSHYVATLFRPMSGLKGRKVLISGAGRGLGEGIATHLGIAGRCRSGR